MMSRAGLGRVGEGTQGNKPGALFATPDPVSGHCMCLTAVFLSELGYVHLGWVDRSSLPMHFADLFDVFQSPAVMFPSLLALYISFTVSLGRRFI